MAGLDPAIHDFKGREQSRPFLFVRDESFHTPSSSGLTGRSSIPRTLDYNLSGGEYWMPAFAGMTEVLTIWRARRTIAPLSSRSPPCA
jgi:hypothetical protein